MEIHELDIEGAWLIKPVLHGDPRGVFLELFKESLFTAAIGHPLHLAQANCSVSARGTVRGIHFADVPPGQGKYVTCLSGSVLDVIVDIRVGSPTFGQWTSVRLDDESRHAVYLSEGLGHGFASLRDGSTVAYFCSEPYAPQREREVHPLDPALGIDWSLPLSDMQLSAKDSAAPDLESAREAGILPSYDECVGYREWLARRS